MIDTDYEQHIIGTPAGQWYARWWESAVRQRVRELCVESDGRYAGDALVCVPPTDGGAVALRDGDGEAHGITIGWPVESRAEARAARLRALGFEDPTEEQLARFALTRIP